MSLRDAVDNCGDGSRAANPVLRMIDQFTSEKQAFRVRYHMRLASSPLSFTQGSISTWYRTEFQLRFYCPTLPSPWLSSSHTSRLTNMISNV